MAAESVKVIVRCRPINEREANMKCQTVISMDSKRAQVHITNIADKKAPPKSFTFDGAYFINSTTEQIYNEIGYPLVEGVTEGYNGTIFAYGQTGCGKSFSMQGITDPPSQRGIIPRAFDHIFETISVAEGTKFLVHAAFLEIYNEDVRDLLAKDTKAKLELKEHPEKGVYVQGLSQHPVHNVAECEQIMSRGWRNRAVGATLMNADSSRSHSIFTIYMEMCQKDDQGEEHIRAGKLNLVDLAGSERQSKTASTGERLKEATKINLSLSALGNVISALVDGKSKHIPYRDSKLTRLLQDSLGGNTKTLMVACVSPADNNYEESLSTLRYANRAKNIKNKPKINEDPKDALLREYQEEIRRLKEMLMGKMPMAVEQVQAKVVPSSIGPATSTEISREVLEEERKNLKEEYDHKLQEIEQRYEEEKTDKVRLQHDISRLRQFYDDKLRNVDGKLAHLPPTAAVLGEVEWNVPDNDTSVKTMVTDQNGVAAVIKSDVIAGDSRDTLEESVGDEMSVQEPDNATSKTDSHISDENVNKMRTAADASPLPTITAPPGWFDTKNLPVEHQELLHSDPNSALADMQRDIMNRLKELQMQMVGGENVDNEEVKERHQKRIKFAEKRKAQLSEAIAGMDDDGIMLTIYDSIQDELRHKNEIVELERNKVLSLECEISDLHSEFEFDRIDYLDTIRKQSKQIKLLEAMLDKIQPCIRRDCNYGNLDRVRSEAKWDDEQQAWIMPKLVVEHTYLPGSGHQTNGHARDAYDDYHRLNGDGSDGQLRQKLSDHDSETYFLPKRNAKYQIHATNSANEVRKAKIELLRDESPYMNGHSPSDESMTADLHAAHVHGQLISTDEPLLRRPARLESLPTSSGEKRTKKKRGHMT